MYRRKVNKTKLINNPPAERTIVMKILFILFYKDRESYCLHLKTGFAKRKIFL